jgi:hypothetical protein
MKHQFVRITLFVLEMLAVLAVVDVGLGLVTRVIRFPLEQLQGTPFSDYTIPGLILAIVVGGSLLVAAVTVLVQRELAVLCSVAAGLIFVGWIIGAVMLLGPFALAWQIPFLVWGLTIFGLASYLWMSEYREHHFPTRPVSHA